MPGPGGPASGRLRFPGSGLGRVPPAGVFFTDGVLRLTARDFIAQGHILFRQSLEPSVIIDLLLHLRGFFSGNAFAEFFPVKEALEDEIRAALAAIGAFEKLFAQRTAPEQVNGLHLVEDLVPGLAKRVDGGWH